MFLFPSDQDEPSQMTQQLPDQALRGRRVLVVEDEYFLADDIVRELKKGRRADHRSPRRRWGSLQCGGR